MKLAVERVVRIRYGWLLSDRWSDWIEAHVSQPRADRWIDTLGELADRIDRAVMERVCAHEAEPDYCGMAAHDLCRGCGKSMPHQARRGAV